MCSLAERPKSIPEDIDGEESVKDQIASIHCPCYWDSMEERRKFNNDTRRPKTDYPVAKKVDLLKYGFLGRGDANFSWAVAKLHTSLSLAIVNIPGGSFLGILPGTVRYT